MMRERRDSLVAGWIKHPTFQIKAFACVQNGLDGYRFIA
jgi:hypothetical protein